jgi:ParB-like chromosome segregation protein Spo0J
MAAKHNPQIDDQGKPPPRKWVGAVEVQIDALIIDSARLRPVDKATVEEYAALMEENGVTFFPPIEIVKIGDESNLVGGSHRIAAAKFIGETAFHARITNGDEDTMVEAIARANLHGRARTLAEKRLAVKTLIGVSKWDRASNRAIARYCGVGDHLVADVRAEIEAARSRSCANPIENIDDRHPPARPVVGADGKTRDISRQGAAAQRTRERERLTADPQPEPAAERPLSFEDSARTGAANTQKAAKATSRYLERLVEVFESHGQTRAEIIDRWWGGLPESDRQRFYDDKIAPWLAAKPLAKPPDAPTQTGRKVVDLSPELWARVKAGEKISAGEAAEIAEREATS